MRSINRGDVPAPHVAPGAGKNAADPGEDVVFDAGSLSFIQDWVDGADGQEAIEPEPERNDPRQSNPNRRLGVGAQPKKSKEKQPEPSALEKKLLRKRQRQEQRDAIASEVGTHGVADDDEDGGRESKTASFKGTKRGRPAKDETGEGVFGVSTVEEEFAVSKGGDGAREEGGKEDGKRKARRKKGRQREAGGGVGPDAMATEMPQPAAASAPASTAEQAAAGEEKPHSVYPEESDRGTKKQRRGWGKARPKSTPAPADGDVGDAPVEAAAGRAAERRPRKKTRSRQKNIRKDNRPLEQRPAHLRAGNPEYCGRDLTEETRKFLGLPVDDFGDASPADRDMPGKTAGSAGWVVDKRPSKIPESFMTGNSSVIGRVSQVDSGGDPGVAVEPRREEAAVLKEETRPSGRSKYKNLALSSGANKIKKKTKKSSN